MNDKGFVGEFKELLSDYVTLKRNLGYKYDTIAANLCRFSVFSLDYEILNKSLSKSLVEDWTAKRPNESINTWEHRASDVRQFALYLQHRGYDSYIPPGKRKIRRAKYIPYIFTHEEIQRFFNACDTIPPHPLSTKHSCFPVLFRLLYSCGLRISEAIHLTKSDVDLDTGILFVRASKFNKDRLIPLSKELWDMFRRYAHQFNLDANPEDYFFRNKSRVPFTQGHVYRQFRELLWRAGISHGGKGKGPRLHDLRHSFCVHTLAKQIHEGVDLYCALPVLSAYLGHTSVAATQHYVRLTAEAYPELVQSVSNTCAYIFPEVEWN